MRTLLLDYIKALKLKQYQVATEYPFSNSGTVLYLKNPKKIYVDNPQIAVENFAPVFSGTIDNEVHTIRVYFVNDAKQLPTEYAELIQSFRTAKDALEIDPSFFRRTCSITTEYENDLLVTTVEYQFTKLS
jgi:hypothetical protein